MEIPIASISSGVPIVLNELFMLGRTRTRTRTRTLTKRAADVLPYFDCPGTINGPVEAINGRLEHLRDSVSATSPTTSTDQSFK